MLNEKLITEFQEIYFKTFGKKIDKKEAYEKAHKLIHLLQIIYKSQKNARKN